MFVPPEVRGLAAPVPKQPTTYAMAARNGRDARAGLIRLSEEPCRVLPTPTTPTLNPGHDLDHERLPLTPHLKARVESPILKDHGRRCSPDGYRPATRAGVSRSAPDRVPDLHRHRLTQEES